MNNKLTDEFLEKLATTRIYPLEWGYVRVGDDIVSMARELQEYRKASKEPVYWQFKSVSGSWIGIGKSGAEQATREGCEVRPLYAAPPLQAVTVPDGWVMVPVEPTPEMREAYHNAHHEYEEMDGLYSPDHQWKSMITAAPQPSSNPMQLVSTTEAAPVLDSTTEITMPVSTLTWPE